MRLAATLAVAFLALAGCLDPITDSFRASDVQPPEWRVGDWWTYHLTSDTYGIDTTVTLVVANETPTGYAIGYPAAQAENATLPLLFHMPAIGPVTEALAYDVHEERFEPIDWPLEDGKSWTATWIGADVRLTAHEENETWRINNTGHEDDAAGLRYEIVYDPTVGAITSFTRTGLDGVLRQGVELVERGTTFTGEIATVGNIRVVLLESRTEGSMAAGAPAVPQIAFAPPEGVDTLLVGCVAGGEPGQYHAEVRNAAGVVCALDTTVQPGAATLDLQVVEAPAEGDGWEARLAAVGQGSATAEVLGYASRVVTLG